MTTDPCALQKKNCSSMALFSFSVALLILGFSLNTHAAVVKKKITLAPSATSNDGYDVIPPKKVRKRSPAAAADAPVALSPDGLLGPQGADQPSRGISIPPVGKLTVFEELISPEMVETAYPKPIHSGKHFYIGLGGDFSANLTGRQVAALQVGYQRSFLNVFLRGRLGLTQWGLIEARPGAADGVTTEDLEGNSPPAIADPSSEYNRVRSPSDSWSVLDAQLGFGGYANLLPVLFPHFSQGAAFTIGTGQYTDVSRNLNFTPFLMGFEACMQYHLGEGKRWAIEGRASYQYGFLQNSAAATQSLGFLPVRWFDAGLSLVLWF
jgi:hypothetical protein